jgi:hypothetical protein
MPEISAEELERLQENLTEHVPVRFPEQLAAAARHLAGQDGMSLSAWIRRLIDRELAAREGQCHACGQPVPSRPGTPENRGDGEH